MPDDRELFPALTDKKRREEESGKVQPSTRVATREDLIALINSLPSAPTTKTRESVDSKVL